MSEQFPFLREYNKGTAPAGQHVVALLGRSNTAMDCARAALRVPGVEKVNDRLPSFTTRDARMARRV